MNGGFGFIVYTHDFNGNYNPLGVILTSYFIVYTHDFNGNYNEFAGIGDQPIIVYTHDLMGIATVDTCFYLTRKLYTPMILMGITTGRLLGLAER